MLTFGMRGIRRMFSLCHLTENFRWFSVWHDRPSASSFYFLSFLFPVRGITKCAVPYKTVSTVFVRPTSVSRTTKRNRSEKRPHLAIARIFLRPLIIIHSHSHGWEVTGHHSCTLRLFHFRSNNNKNARDAHRPFCLLRRRRC